MKKHQERPGLRIGVRRATRGAALALAVVGMTACEDLLDVDLPAQLTDAALEDPSGAQTQLNTVIGHFECGYADFVWEAFGNESGGQYITTRGAGTHNFPSAVAAGNSCSTDPREIAYYANFQRSRRFAYELHDKLDEWTVAQVPNRARWQAVASLYAGASLAWMGSTLCEASINAGPLMTPAQVYTLADQWLTKALTEITATGDFAVPYGIATSASTMAYGLRAQLRWMSGDKTGAKADAERVPRGFFAWATREPGPQRMNMPWVGSTNGFTEIYDVIDWWRGPNNPVTGQAWPNVLPFTGWRNLGILSDGRAVREDGLPIRTAGNYRNPDEGTAVADTRVRHVNVPIQGGGIGPVPNRYGSEGDDLPLVNWKEMWLIRAEIEGGQRAIDLVNELRTADNLPRVTYLTGATATPQQIKYMIIEERRRSLFLEGRFYYTKLQNPDILWFPRGVGATPAAGWRMGGGVRYTMPQDEYQLNTNLKLEDQATGCAANNRPVLVG